MGIIYHPDSDDNNDEEREREDRTAPRVKYGWTGEGPLYGGPSREEPPRSSRRVRMRGEDRDAPPGRRSSRPAPREERPGRRQLPTRRRDSRGLERKPSPYRAQHDEEGVERMFRSPTFSHVLVDAVAHVLEAMLAAGAYAAGDYLTNMELFPRPREVYEWDE